VDTEGLVVKAKGHSAKVTDQDGLRLLLELARRGLSRLRHLFGWRPPRREGKREGLSRYELGLGCRTRARQAGTGEGDKGLFQEWAQEKIKRSIGRDLCSSEASWSNWTHLRSVTLASENTLPRHWTDERA
jgi:hypothetical protein